jgi:hypothetical protein
VSGFTKVSKTFAYHRLTLSTPNIGFVPNPATGKTGEQAYHDEARRKFSSELETVGRRVEERLAAVRDTLQLLPVGSSEPSGSSEPPISLTLLIRGTVVEVSLRHRPQSAVNETKALLEALARPVIEES